MSDMTRLPHPQLRRVPNSATERYCHCYIGHPPEAIGDRKIEKAITAVSPDATEKLLARLGYQVKSFGAFKRPESKLQ